MERRALLDILWSQAEPLLFISREEFDRGKDGWDIRPVEVGGELAGITLHKGPEFHFTTTGTCKRISRKLMLEILSPIIAEYGCVLTRTPKDDERQHRFNRLFGFEQVGEDTFDILYRLERLPGSSTCP